MWKSYILHEEYIIIIYVQNKMRNKILYRKLKNFLIW